MREFFQSMLLYFAILIACLGIVVPGAIAAVVLRWLTDNAVVAISGFVGVTLLVVLGLALVRVGDDL